MLHKIKLQCMMIAVVSAFFVSNAHATAITLSPANTSVTIGDAFGINMLADIDQADAIIGFGFDLSLSGTGSLAFSGFTPAVPTFGVDPVHAALSDSDGILGDSAGNFLLGPPVWGNDILLGTLSFTATGAGNAVVGLGADDLNIWFTEGLIPVDINKTNFMPSVVAVNVTVNQPSTVPEPATILLFGAGLIGIRLIRRASTK